MLSDKKVLKAIKSTEEYIKKAEEKGLKETFEMGNDIGFTTLWCEKRNLKKYKEMLGKDKRKLEPELKELYQTI
jgi:hypothetical protein